MKTNLSIQRGFGWTILCGALALSAGCTKQAVKTAGEPASSSVQPQPRDDQHANDQQILGELEARIQGEAALNGQPVAVAFSQGVATLSGTVDNAASRALAAADSGGIEGVRTVVNNLEVAPPKAAKPVKAPSEPRRHRMQVAQAAAPAAAAPEPAPEPPPAPAAPPAEETVQTVAPPPPPPPPVAKTVTLAVGTVLPIRLTDALDSSVTQPNSVFHGSLATDLVVDGMIAAPRGASVIGRVVEVKDAAHFSGSSELSIELTTLYAQNREILLVTDAYTKQGAGRGKNTAVKAGGGAVLGALIGALAGGGKGAAIGAATGGGIGAGTNGVSRGQQVQIPSETLVNFRLQSPVSVTTTRTAGSSRNSPDTQLEQRQ